MKKLILLFILTISASSAMCETLPIIKRTIFSTKIYDAKVAEYVNPKEYISNNSLESFLEQLELSRQKKELSDDYYEFTLSEYKNGNQYTDPLYGASVSKEQRVTITELLNFKINSTGDVIWQKVFEGNNSTATDILKNPKFRVTQSTDTYIIGNIIDDIMNVEKYGFGTNDVPIIYHSPSTVNFKIDIKDNRYRVTVSDIKWKSHINLSFSMMSSNNNTTLNLNSMALQKGEHYFRKAWFKDGMSKVLDLWLIDTFTLKEDLQSDDNW